MWERSAWVKGPPAVQTHRSGALESSGARRALLTTPQAVFQPASCVPSSWPVSVYGLPEKVKDYRCCYSSWCRSWMCWDLVLIAPMAIWVLQFPEALWANWGVGGRMLPENRGPGVAPAKPRLLWEPLSESAVCALWPCSFCPEGLAGTSSVRVPLPLRPCGCFWWCALTYAAFRGSQSVAYGLWGHLPTRCPREWTCCSPLGGHIRSGRTTGGKDLHRTVPSCHSHRRSRRIIEVGDPLQGVPACSSWKKVTLTLWG